MIETPYPIAGAPVPAATVVVLRRRAERWEVFLVRRHGRSAFMPDFYVFPGGRLDDADRTFARALADGGAPPRPLAGLSDGVESDAFRLAAIRETAEEAGVLLAVDGDGAMADDATSDRVALALRDGEDFADVLARHGLRPALDALRPLGWWITPPFETRQFDTRFFLAEAPAGQIAAHDAIETTAGHWMTAADAIEQFHAGEISLAPPTLATLELLAAHATPAAAAAALPSPLVPIQPQRKDVGEEHFLALPGDELFDHEAPRALPHRTRFRRIGKMRFV